MKFGSNAHEDIMITQLQNVEKTRFDYFLKEFIASVKFWKLCQFGCVVSSNGYANFR